LRKSVFIVLLLLTGLAAFSQAQPSLKGKVICKTDNKPVDMAAVVIKELNIWSTTDEDGNYILKSVPNGKYTIAVTCLGYVQFEQEITFPYMAGELDLHIEQSTLALDEIVVVAQEGKRMGSESVISQSAIQHVQPTDLSDVMQLLPGQITVNPDLSDPKQLTIREINASGDEMASLGTALIIDGATVSNDANMQFKSTATASGGLTDNVSSFSSTASGGVDVRQVSVDNIESIEIVRGVGSVESGDVLSGSVKVTMKKGKTPFTAKIKTDPGIKQFYAGKGFNLGKNSGTLNVDFDYTRSLDDIRTAYKTFNRLNAGLIWSNTFMREKKPLTLNFSMRESSTIDIRQNDPDMLDVEKFEANEKGFTLNLNGKWALNSKLLTNLNFLLSGNVQHQVAKEIDLETSSLSPQPISYVSGEFEAPILPSSYLSNLTIDGRPYYFESKISGNKSFHIGKSLNNLNGGIEWKISGNNGNGSVYDLSRPPSASSSTTSRPRSYKDIPAINQYSMYFEENLNIPVGTTKFDLQAGLRFTNLQPDGLFSSQRDIIILDPRTNLRYILIDNQKGAIKKLALRGGYGLFSKAPTMPFLYPDKAYWDKVGFNYYDAAAQEGLIVVQTQVYDDPGNNNLKAAINRKLEGGIDLTVNDIDMSVTLYSEKMDNGFSFESHFQNLVFNNYDNLTIVGANPYYINGDGVYYSDPVSGEVVKVSSVKDTVFTSYSIPSNTSRTIKKGLEFTIDFGNIKALRTSFVLDGAYMKISKQNMRDFWEKPSGVGSTGDKEYPYVALYPGGKGSITKRFNTNLRTITHIKELRMVITTTIQAVWFYSTQNIYNDKNGNPLVYTDKTVKNIYTDYSGLKHVNPLGYIDHTLVYHEFDPSQAISKPYSDLIDQPNQWYFIQRRYSPYFQVNIKLTKEITNLVDISFYANNVTNYQPLVKVKGVPETYAKMNAPLYFGAELKIKF
jgi:hypothetical protein